MIDLLWEVLFWGCAGLMLHTYVFYPLTLKLLPVKFIEPGISSEDLPTIAVLIPAYNEASVIREKIENSLGLAYPSDKLEVLVGSDGSTDDTDKIVSGVNNPRVRLIRFDGRNGKPCILNRLVEETHAEILVLTDANVSISAEDFTRLIRHFTDSSVAAVGAAKKIALRGSHDAVGKGEHTYHQRMTNVKSREASVGGFSGLSGAAYAIRKSEWEPLPLVAMNDDIVSLYPAIMRGKRVAFEPSVIGIEHSGETVHEEFRRRIRIGVSNFRTLSICRRLLSLSRPVVAYTFFSNKVIHWFFPVLMIGALLSNVVLAFDSELYKQFLFVQLAAYALAGLGGLFALIEVRIPIAYQAFSFVTIMFAFLLGGFRFIVGSGTSVWERSSR